MTVHHARSIALAAVLVGISALILSPSVRAQQPVSQLPLDELRALAEQGDAGAQFTLGLRCQFGLGVPEDNAEAVRWYRLAANQGLSWAQHSLGVMYDNGRGVPQDDTEAVRVEPCCHQFRPSAPCPRRDQDHAQSVTAINVSAAELFATL